MLKYNYRYVITLVGAMGILALIAHVIFPMEGIGSIFFFLFPILAVLWRFLNFIEVEDDGIVLISLLKRRHFKFKDIRKIVLDKDSSLNKGTLQLTVFCGDKTCTVPFGNLKYGQAKQVKKLIGNKANVVIF